MCLFNTLRPRHHGRRFPEDIFKRILLNENVWVSIKISLQFVPKGSISNIPALVQIMAWRRPSDKPLSEPMVVNLLMHKCVTRPQWVLIVCLGYYWLRHARCLCSATINGFPYTFSPIPFYSNECRGFSGLNAIFFRSWFVLMCFLYRPILTITFKVISQQRDNQWPLLLTWFNFNPSMDK